MGELPIVGVLVGVEEASPLRRGGVCGPSLLGCKHQSADSSMPRLSCAKRLWREHIVGRWGVQTDVSCSIGIVKGLGGRMRSTNLAMYADSRLIVDLDATLSCSSNTLHRDLGIDDRQFIHSVHNET